MPILKLAEKTGYDDHIVDSTIHFVMSAINITESQISDLQSYLLSSDIGVSIQPYSADTVIDAVYVHTDENFTGTLKTKLNGVEVGANNYTHPATHPASIIALDTTNFDKALSAADDTTQKAMETLDDQIGDIDTALASILGREI